MGFAQSNETAKQNLGFTSKLEKKSMSKFQVAMWPLIISGSVFVHVSALW